MSSKAFPFTLREQLFFVLLVVGYVLFDLAVLPIHQLILGAIINTTFGGCVEAWVIGCYLAQVGILGCWSAMFSGSLVLRLLIANLLLVTVYFSIHWVLESNFSDVLWMRQIWFKQTGWATLVICLNATQIPLLAMRRATGYSLVLPGETVAQSRVRQFSIADLLGLMTFATVPLFIMSTFLVPLVDVPFLAAIIIATGIISWLFLWIGLRPQMSVFSILFLVLIGPVIVWLVFGLCLGRWTGNYWTTPVHWIYPSAYLGVITQVTVAVLSARVFGYRLLKSKMHTEA